MKYRLVYALLFLILFSSATFARFNTWEPENGLQVRQGFNVSWTSNGIAVDDEGNWCVSWSDGHLGEYNVYAQLYDPNGNPLWGEEPLLIAEGPWIQQNSNVFKGDDDSWIIAWDDFRNDVNKESLIIRYAQKVADNGTFIWADQGVPIFDSPRSSQSCRTISDNNGGLFHVWYHHDYGIWMQHLDSNGSRLWGLDGLLYQLDYSNFSFTSADNDLIIMSWNSYGSSLINFNRFNINGEAEWGTNGITIDPGRFLDRQTSILADNNGNIYSVWSYFGSNDIDAMAIDSDGYTLCEYTTIVTNGSRILENSGFITGTNNFRIVYYDSDDNIYLQDVSLTGNGFELAYGTTGLTITNLTQNVDLVCFSDGNNGYFMTYRERLNYDVSSYFLMIHVDSLGQLTWDEPLSISAFDFPKVNTIIADDNVIIVKKDNYENNVGLYFDYLDAENGSMINNNPNHFNYTIVEGIQFNSYNQGIAKSGANVYTTWVDSRYDEIKLPFIQKNSLLTGENEWTENGIPIVSINAEGISSYYCSELKAISDGENGVYAAFGSNGQYASGESFYPPITVQRINENSELLWGEEGVYAIDIDSYNICSSRDPYLFINDQNEICLFFEVHTTGIWSNGIVFQKFSPDGERLLGDTGVIVSSINAYENNILKVIPHGENFHVFYQHGNAQQTTLLLASVRSDGELLWDEPVELGAYYDNGYYNRRDAVKAGSNTAVVWYDSATGAYVGNIIDLNGNRVNSPEPVEIFVVPYFTHQLSLAEADDNSFWFGHICNGRTEMILNRFNLNFNSLLENQCIITAENPVDAVFEQIKLIPDLEQGINITWIESDNDLWTNDIYHHHLNSEGMSADAAYGDFGLPVCNAWYCQFEMNSVPDDEGGFLMTWNDFRASYLLPEDMEGSSVFITRINDNITEVKPSGFNNIPTEWALLPAYPNPFNPVTSIKYHVADISNVKISIYDVLGRKVTNLINGQHSAGNYSVIWNGRNSMGVDVSSGTYYYNLETDNVNLTRSMILLK